MSAFSSSIVCLGQAAGPSGAGALTQLVPFALIFAVMYFVIIRPQTKQAKKQAEFIAALKKGDAVVLQSGVFGKVASVGDKDAQIEVAPNVVLRVVKSTIAGPAAESESVSSKS